MEPSTDRLPVPYVRDVDAYYENGVFYITSVGTKVGEGTYGGLIFICNRNKC